MRAPAFFTLLGLWSATATGNSGSHVGDGVSVAEGAEEAARQYDPKLARALAALAKLVYCGPLNGTAEAILRSTSGVMREAGLQLDSPRLVTHSDLGAADADFAAVARFSALDSDSYLPARGCVIAFRGTDNEANNVENHRQRLENWESSEDDACVGCQVCEGCKVFGGYKAIWRQLRPRVLRELERLGCQSGDPLLLTGHNLGAGLMTLAMYSLKSQDAYNVQLSYNFGSPRVGNTAFAKSFNHFFGWRVSIFRVTRDNDAVPHLPNNPDYAHVGNQVWYPHNNAEEYTICANSTAGQRCGNDAISEDQLCPLTEEECKGDVAHCRATCGFPPAQGPHCVHPLAPADNFCSFAGDAAEQMSEKFERSCVWGKAAMMTTAAPTIPGSVACAEEEVSWQPLDMLGTLATYAETAADCQELCEKTEGCEHFTFFYSFKHCHREDHMAYSMSHSLGVTSGPKACSEHGMEAKFLAAPLGSGSATAGLVIAVLLVAGCAMVLSAAVCMGFRSCRMRKRSLRPLHRVDYGVEGTAVVRTFWYQLLSNSLTG
uniref:Apple domain-containing protein n=1 Tax=Alexandrium catenella TaxID=2925 RepID=A0A7S1M076_ALECA|mmetsp:Transcript_17272/g.46882  ORF Transcript_17272/g.46882 Transcript_17272/m.46882 type:complete len:546 (+) Transcript_17272:102-1739(+)